MTTFDATDLVSPALRTHFDHARLRERTCRVLSLRGRYFLMDECAHALRQRGHDVVAIDTPRSGTFDRSYVRDLLVRTAEFKPDFVFAVNHYGFDSNGQLARLFHQLGIPLAVWYVEDLQMRFARLSDLATPSTAVFVSERTWAERFHGLDCHAAEHLPMGFDDSYLQHPDDWISECRKRLVFCGRSFVGESRALREELEGAPRVRDETIEALAFGARWSDRELLAAVEADNASRQIQSRMLLHAGFEAASLWRRHVVSALPQDALTIAGDAAWREICPSARHLGHIDYRTNRMPLYRSAEVVVDVPSRRTPTGVNQRVFDVPMAGGFVLTEAREDLEAMFPEDARATFTSAEECVAKAEWFRAHPSERRRISQRAAETVLQHHTYAHRIDRMIERMRALFGR
jgi:spore maturation protein CgeB